MAHPNAALTPRHRLKVTHLVVDDGWPISEVAARFQVSGPAVKRGVERYRVGQSMQDRSSRPHHSPNKTSAKTSRRCITLRLHLREAPVQMAFRLGIAPSTVHRVLTSVHLDRLSHVDRATGEPIRRYEHDHPGTVIHVVVKKLGTSPKAEAGATSAADKAGRTAPRHPASRVTNTVTHFWATPTSTPSLTTIPASPTQIHDDETAQTATAVLIRAVEWFNQRGITVERVLSDNGGAYRSHLWRAHAPNLKSSTSAPPVSPTDERQGRALPPHPGRRMSLRPLLYLRG